MGHDPTVRAPPSFHPAPRCRGAVVPVPAPWFRRHGSAPWFRAVVPFPRFRVAKCRNRGARGTPRRTPTGVSLCSLRHLGRRGASKTRRRHGTPRRRSTEPCAPPTFHPAPWFRVPKCRTRGARGTPRRAPSGVSPCPLRHLGRRGAQKTRRGHGTTRLRGTEPCAGGPRRTRRARKLVCRRREMAAGRRLGSCLMP